MKKINFLEKQNNKLKNELKIEKYPNGSLVYIVDYTDEQENMYRLGKSDDMNKRNAFAAKNDIKLYRPDPTYNPNVALGLDPIMGDIIFEPSELPIIRGGWYDRNNFFYSDDIKEMGLKSVNIIRKGTVDSSKRQKI